ncbi:hypothetical protein WOSG25_090670 [Weissella oryzae SG25]|uniref:Uncharacterized protein n=1 Tax=Weissella oryzae (strain DSM 25784 / JCM 18191 / LMG 30913 / SG25) TaxID=1329250 RepID=A0A069CUA1_WEIOS|nr:hypothetical protein [Weissella oryzae]GAK31370.1 hypothetical protein WOSG25_090670 [Weissella oryzae SG25]
MSLLDLQAKELGFKNWQELRKKLPNTTAQRLINDLILKEL